MASGTVAYPGGMEAMAAPFLPTRQSAAPTGTQEVLATAAEDYILEWGHTSGARLAINGSKTHLPPIVIFSSDFGHLLLRCTKNNIL